MSYHVEMRPDPPVMKWFRIYAGLMAALYSLCAIGSLFMYKYASLIADEEMSELEARIMAIIFFVLCFVLAAVFLVPFFVKRKSWVWVYDVALIGIGLSGGCTIIPCLFLLLAFIKPEVQQLFGRK